MKYLMHSWILLVKFLFGGTVTGITTQTPKREIEKQKQLDANIKLVFRAFYGISRSTVRYVRQAISNPQPSHVC